MNIFDLSPREFNDFLLEEAQYRSAQEIDDLRRRYREQNSLAGMIRRGLTAEEGRRRSTFLPIDAPQGMSIWDAITSGEAGISLPQGLVDMLAGGVRAVESPAEYAMSIPPRADALGDAFNVAGMAMLGGGAVAKPAGSLGSNMIGFDNPKGDWLAGKVRRAEQEMKEGGKGLSGPTTAYTKQTLMIPIDQLSTLKGAMDEMPRAGQRKYDDLMQSMQKEGFRNDSPVLVGVNHRGEPYIVEGNNRVAVAKEMGIDKIPVEVRWYNGGEDVSQSWSPQAVQGMAMANASKSAGALTVAADVAERGDTILNMLKSGQADNITDAMLDMGDSVKNTQLNQYLFQNYDLPMDYDSRMARQREMLPEKGLHGTVTSKDFTSFRDDIESYIAPQSPEGLDLVAQFSSAEQGRVLPVVHTGDILDTSSPEGMFQQRRDFQAIYDERGLGDFRAGDNGLPSWTDMTAINTAKDAGYGGIRLEERDWVNSTAIYEPRNIRSKFARFDPRLSHLSNLTAANMSPLGGLVAQGMVSQEELEDYLRQKGL